jgi:hypothetical protein
VAGGSAAPALGPAALARGVLKVVEDLALADPDRLGVERQRTAAVPVGSKSHSGLLELVIGDAPTVARSVSSNN